MCLKRCFLFQPFGYKKVYIYLKLNKKSLHFYEYVSKKIA